MIQFDEHMFQMGWFNHQLESHQKPTAIFPTRLAPQIGVILTIYKSWDDPPSTWYRIFTCF